ncbi:MAG: hypothetical protein NT069_03855 [Planctomycetota bacterium]|nr:hypothetical protein [Planctomycetota bacterium]
MRSLLRGSMSLACVVCLGLQASAQEFRVYTKIYDVRAEAAAKGSRKQSVPVSRTTTLFHAGKVYDALDAGERMTVYEPAHNRFLILDGSRQLRTEVTTAEISGLIRSAERSAQEYIDGKGKSSDIGRVPLLQFQLAPDFTESVDDRAPSMRLNGSGALYEVKCVEPESEEYVKSYLEYADWAARLNYVVHAHAPLPGPRLALDESLRRHGWLPVEVVLQSRQKNGPHLRAEHVYVWKLDEFDRKLITKAENELAQPKMKEVDFDTFLQRTQAGTVQAKR